MITKSYQIFPNSTKFFKISNFTKFYQIGSGYYIPNVIMIKQDFHEIQINLREQINVPEKIFDLCLKHRLTNQF